MHATCSQEPLTYHCSLCTGRPMTKRNILPLSMCACCWREIVSSSPYLSPPCQIQGLLRYMLSTVSYLNSHSSVHVASARRKPHSYYRRYDRDAVGSTFKLPTVIELFSLISWKFIQSPRSGGGQRTPLRSWSCCVVATHDCLQEFWYLFHPSTDQPLH